MPTTALYTSSTNEPIPNFRRGFAPPGRAVVGCLRYIRVHCGHSRFSLCHSVDGAPCAIPLAGLFPVPDGLSGTVLPAAFGAELPPLAGVGLGEPCGLGEVVQLRRGGSLGNFGGVANLPGAWRTRSSPGACRGTAIEEGVGGFTRCGCGLSLARATALGTVGGFYRPETLGFGYQRFRE